jgi:hypothetical protein
MAKVLLFGGVYLKPTEFETTNDNVEHIFVPYSLGDDIIGIEYKRRTGTNLYYSDYQLSKEEQKAFQMQEWIEIESAKNHA